MLLSLLLLHVDGVRPSGPGKGEQADVLEEKGQGGQT